MRPLQAVLGTTGIKTFHNLCTLYHLINRIYHSLRHLLVHAHHNRLDWERFTTLGSSGVKVYVVVEDSSVRLKFDNQGRLCPFEAGD